MIVVQVKDATKNGWNSKIWILSKLSKIFVAEKYSDLIKVEKSIEFAWERERERERERENLHGGAFEC